MKICVHDRFTILPCPLPPRSAWPGALIFLVNLLTALAFGQGNYAPYTFTTLAGSASFGSADGSGRSAQFHSPAGVAVDAAGNIYVADSGNHTIRKVTPDGVVTTLAGLAGSAGSADGSGSAARFDRPLGVAVDSAGCAYVADTANHTIRKITPDGAVSTLAGLAGVPGVADGPGGAARFNQPHCIAVDPSGTVYVGDVVIPNASDEFPGLPTRIRPTIRKIAPDGAVTTVEIAFSAWSSVMDIAVDGAGNVYLAVNAGADPDNGFVAVSKLTPTGSLTSLGGFYSGWGHLAVDGFGTVLFAGAQPGGIYLIRVDGETMFLAGAPMAIPYDGDLGPPPYDGQADGVGTEVRFNNPQGIAADAAGFLYVADTDNHTVRKGQPYPFPIIAKPPADKKSSTAQRPAFTVSAGSSLPANYRWQRQTAGSSSWIDLSGDTEFNGATTATLTVNAATVAMNGDSFHCVVTNANGSVTSSPATLAVFPGAPLTVLTVAGQAGSSGSADGTGSAARFNFPGGVAGDDGGNIYVADAENNTVRKITPEGTVTTIAGLAGSSGSADGIGSAARFDFPRGVAVDGAGNIYVADVRNNTIRKITPEGTVTTLAGMAKIGGEMDGTGSEARFNSPMAIAIDLSGNLYVSSGLNGTTAVRRVTPTGVVTTLGARFPRYVEGWALDGAGNLVVADLHENSVCKMNLTTGAITTVAGSGAFGGDDGPAGEAQFQQPTGVAVDRAGNIFVADSGNHAIRRIAPDGTVTTAAGASGLRGSEDGVGGAARFDGLNGLQIAVDRNSKISIADTNSHTIRVAYVAAPSTIATQPESRTATVGQSATFSVLAGGLPSPTYQWQRQAVGSTFWENLRDGGNYSGTTNATLTVNSLTIAMSGDQFRCVITNAAGSSTSNTGTLTVTAGAGAVLLQFPTGIACDTTGNLYVADASHNDIRKVTLTGVVSTLAGASGLTGSQDGTGDSARFNQPSGVAVDSVGNVYLADTGNGTIRKVSSAGAVTTLAGTPVYRGSVDASGVGALFSAPTGLAIDAAGNLYAADSTNATIRKVTPTGVVSTLAGLAGNRGEADGIGSAARFNFPNGVAVDGAGSIYVADTYNHTIRKISPAGAVNTLAGSAGISGDSDLVGANALFNQPYGVAVNSAGNVYVADAGNATIRRIAPSGAVTTVAGMSGIAGLRDGSGNTALFNQPRALALDSTGNLYVADTGNAVIRRITPNASVTTLALTASTEGTDPPPAGGTTNPPSATGTGNASGSGGGPMDSRFASLLMLWGAARWIPRRS